MGRRAILFPLVLAFVTLAQGSLCAQVDYANATLKGTIFDPQGLVVAGATVTVTNPGTGSTRAVHTSDAGIYFVPLLPPGAYKIRIQAVGFANAMGLVTVSVGEILNYNVHLRLGTAGETVEVVEELPVVSPEQTQQANTIGERQIAGWPNLTHTFTDLVLTLPGISNSEVPRAQTPGFSGFVSTGFSIGGSNGRSNLVTIDGGENDMGAGAMRTPHVPAESIQEFQVNRSSFAAEFGFTAGSAVNVVTRSGGNRWHGGTYAWLRDHHTDAANYFARRAKAFEQDFETGFTLGGPLLKNKLFWFTAFEFRKGDSPQFRSYATSDAAKGILANPAQQDYVNLLASSGNAQLKAIARQLQFLLDPANFPNATALLVPNTGAFNDWKKYYNSVTRVDYQPGTADSIITRFGFLEDDGSRMWALDPSNAPDDATLGYQRDFTLLVAWNHIFNERFMNQLRVQVVPSSTMDSPVASPHTAYLRIAGLGQFGGEHYQPFYALERRFQFEDAVTVARGKHTLKFGASYRPFSYRIRQELFFGGEFQFWDGAIPIVGGLIPPTSPTFTPLVNFNLAHGFPASGDPSISLSSLQSFDVGIPVAYRQGFGNPQVAGWEHYFGAYVQDSWKMSHALTINFGGRMDVYAPASPVPRNVYFSPRLGFAWSPDRDHKTVIRGGGGIFVAPIPFFVDYIVKLFSDSGGYINQVATALSATDRRVLTLWSMLSSCNPQQPWVCTQHPPFSQLSSAQVGAAGFHIGPGQPGRAVGALRQPYKSEYTVQASLSVQRQLGANVAIELGYQMYHGLHLQVPLDTNVAETGAIDPFVGPGYAPIDPEVAQLVTYASIGNSIYHGLIASLTRRFSSGLQFQINYTFSKAIDDTTDFNSSFMPFRPTRMDLERSLSTFDVRHNFVANAVYTTPFKSGRGILSIFIADVTISPVLFLRSGIPFTIRVPGMQNGTLGESLWARPWHAGRNTGRGPNFHSLDMRIAKSFFVNREAGRRIDFVVQSTNVLNHTNFSAVNDTFPANPNPFQVGSQTIDLLNGPYDLHGIRGLDASRPLAFKAAFDARQLQFGVKLAF